MVVVPGEWTSAVPLWSTVEVAAGPITTLNAFSYTSGDVVPGSVGPRMATAIDTNLQGEGSKLPENEEIAIHYLAIDVFKQGLALDPNAFPDPDQPEVPLPDMLRLQRDTLIELSIAAVKNYTQSPLSYWPGAAGVQHVYSGGLTRVSDGATGTAVAYNGSTSTEGVRALASPLYVAGGEAFKVALSFNKGEVAGLNLQTDARLVCRLFLDGFRRRAVA
jgi:hypothetical protein